MRSAAGTSHLLLKGNTYYFRHAVPREHRAALGCRELRRSLGTGYVAEARMKAKRLALAVRDVFRMLGRMTREGGFVDEDLKDVREFVDTIFRDALEENEMQRFTDCVKNYPKEMDYLPGDTEKRIAYFKGILARRDYARLEGLARVFCEEDVGVEFPEDPVKRRMLAHEIAKHFINYYTICTRRSQGDFNFEKTLYPPQSEEFLDSLSTEVKSGGPAAPAVTLSKVIEEYVQDQTLAGNWTERSTGDIVSTLHNLIDILGDVPVSSIDFAAMRTFKTTLMQLPPNRKKSKEYRDKSIAEILRAAPKKRLGKTTFNNIVTNISSFFEWCVRHGYLKENYARGLKLRTRNERMDGARAVFTPEDLATMFNAKGYRGDSFKQPYMFWIPLLCVFTGARLEELCQLYVEDVREVDGVWVLDINENPGSDGKRDKHLKTASSIRLIPIHPVLLDLGVLRFHASVVKSGEKRLFPELKKIRNRYGHAVSKWFSRFRKSVGLDSELHDLHAFRHTVIDFFKKQRIPKDIYSDVTGHAQEGTAESVYAKAHTPTLLLQEVVEKIDYGLDLSHLNGSKFGNGATQDRKG